MAANRYSRFCVFHFGCFICTCKVKSHNVEIFPELYRKILALLFPLHSMSFPRVIKKPTTARLIVPLYLKTASTIIMSNFRILVPFSIRMILLLTFYHFVLCTILCVAHHATETSYTPYNYNLPFISSGMSSWDDLFAANVTCPNDTELACYYVNVHECDIIDPANVTLAALSLLLNLAVAVYHHKCANFVSIMYKLLAVSDCMFSLLLIVEHATIMIGRKHREVFYSVEFIFALFCVHSFKGVFIVTTIAITVAVSVTRTIQILRPFGRPNQRAVFLLLSAHMALTIILVITDLVLFHVLPADHVIKDVAASIHLQIHGALISNQVYIALSTWYYLLPCALSLVLLVVQGHHLLCGGGADIIQSAINNRRM